MNDQDFKVHVLDELSDIKKTVTDMRLEFALWKGKAMVVGSLGVVIISVAITYILR